MRRVRILPASKLAPNVTRIPAFRQSWAAKGRRRGVPRRRLLPFRRRWGMRADGRLYVGHELGEPALQGPEGRHPQLRPAVERHPRGVGLDPGRGQRRLVRDSLVLVRAQEAVLHHVHVALCGDHGPVLLDEDEDVRGDQEEDPRRHRRLPEERRLHGLALLEVWGDGLRALLALFLIDRHAAYAAFCTLPAFRQRVQTYSRRGAPPTSIRTFWRFGLKRRLVATIEWLRLCPNAGFLPHT